ncbi:hypothetical protein MAPG_00734 [Magnaporthiopsis poae ATCC 64411]|uniref:Rhodopsin domain-containing protein n=1 Tax=Magnaporthiopsis poae (strain ATCC 64411 / 73-15) TaxID=644358 RepID=A0A0C4DLT8_MAGP6|nr:hypothetical protein MAPG_00734 [Magnaporthiopsis poae ATCC 64411]
MSSVTVTTVGFGSHFDTIPPEMLEMYIRYGLPTFSLYVWGSVAAKLAYAFYYLRLFSDRQHALLNKALVVFLLLQGISETLGPHLMCRPFSKALVPTIPGSCAGVDAFYMSFFGIKLFSDLVLFVQPIPVLWGLKLSAGKKAVMFLLLSIGVFVCIFSVVRIRLVSSTYKGGDPTYNIVDAMLWSEIEIFSLILCECAPSLQTLGARMGSIVAALIFATTANRPIALQSDDQPRKEASDNTPHCKCPGSKWRDHRGSRNRSKYGGTGTSSRSSRGSRFGVTSLVSATRRLENGSAADQLSAWAIPGKAEEPPEPTHGSIMVTHDIEIGIEVDDGGDDDDDGGGDDCDGSNWGDDSLRPDSPSLSLEAKPVEPLEPF